MSAPSAPPSVAMQSLTLTDIEASVPFGKVHDDRKPPEEVIHLYIYFA